MVLSYVAESSSTAAPPLYNPVAAAAEPWTLDGEAWGDWSTTLPPLPHHDPQSAWDGCIQDIHQCLTTMEVIMSSLDPKDRDSSTLQGVMSRIEHLREWLDVSDDEDYPALFLPAFSPKELPSPPRVPSPVPVPVSSGVSVPIKAEMRTSTVATISTSSVSKTRSCDAVATTTTTTTRRDAKRRKTATPADLRKTCEKQLLWTIMKLLKETAPEHFPFGKKDKTRLEDLRSALAVYNGPWGSMVIPQIVQERLAWKLKLSLSPFCRQLIDFLLEQKQGLGDGYREMIIRMGFVHTVGEADGPKPLKHLLETERWEPRRRTSFEVEVVTGPSNTTTTLPLNGRYQPRTPLLELLEEVTHKVTTGLHGLGGDGSECRQLFVVVRISGPPQRSFLLRGCLDDWELCDHTQECSVRISSDHVVCHMMLERSDTSILVYPSLQQALTALSRFAPSGTPEPFVSLVEEPPAWRQPHDDDDEDEGSEPQPVHPQPILQHHQPQQQPQAPQEPGPLPCAPASATSNTVPSLSPPPVASFCDFRSRHALGLLNLPEALGSNGTSTNINIHHNNNNQQQQQQQQHHVGSSNLMSGRARVSPPSGPLASSSLAYAVSPLVISSSSSSPSSTPSLASPDSTGSEPDNMMCATSCSSSSSSSSLPPVLPPLRIVVPAVSSFANCNTGAQEQQRGPHHHAGDFSPISFFTSLSPTAMATD